MQRSQPRSILKASRAHSYSEDALVNIAIPTESQSSSSQTGVRFPSTPKLSTVHYTHCPASYDRSPILVLPNSCALPARGCRDYSTTGRQEQVYGKHAHPSRIQAPSTSGSDYSGLAPPMLMQDEGSSEESGESLGNHFSSTPLYSSSLVQRWTSFAATRTCPRPPSVTKTSSVNVASLLRSPLPSADTQARFGGFPVIFIACRFRWSFRVLAFFLAVWTSVHSQET